MDERQANAVADALGGHSWQSGGGIYLVLVYRADGRLVVISDEAVCKYEDDEGFEQGDALQTINLH